MATGRAADKATDKAALRHEIRRSRAAEPPDVRVRRAQLLMSHGAALATRAGSAVAGFQPTNHEPDISALLMVLALPVYLPRALSASELEWVRARPDDLRGGHRGIPRPKGPAVALGPGIASLGVGVMLVPALAVDPSTGARLGYGAGFYDRLLADLSPAVFTVAVCREQDQRVLPVEAHDVPVAAVLTESGLVSVGSAGDAPAED